MIYALMRSETGLTWDDILYNISYQNLIMLSKCTPNYNFDKKEKGIRTTSTGNNMPEFGAKGNVGNVEGLISFFKNIRK